MTDIKVLKARKRTLEQLAAGSQFIAGSKGIPSRYQWSGVVGDALTELLQLTGVRVTVSVPDLNSLNAAKQQLEEELRELETEAAAAARAKDIELLKAQFQANATPAVVPPDLSSLIAQAVAAALASQAPKPQP